MYQKKWIAYFMILPMLIFLSMFLFYPFLINIKNSFYHFENILDKTPIFIGIQNYKSMITDSIFIGSSENGLLGLYDGLIGHAGRKDSHGDDLRV